MPSGKKPKTVTLGREERLAKVAALDRRGWSQTRIANELGVTQPQISQDLRLVYDRYRDSTLNDKGAELNRQIGRLEDVIAEAFDGWYRSMEDAVRVTQESAPPLPPKEKAPRGTPSGRASTAPSIVLKLQVIKETTVRTGQSGDARYLSVIKDSVAEIARLRGLYPTEGAAAGRDQDRDAPPGFWDAFVRAFTGADVRQSPEERVETLDGRVPRVALPESATPVQEGAGNVPHAREA